jgi:peptide/nickel transport system substrate-binding protein
MTYLTDRKRIVKELMLGYAEIAVSPFSPRSPQHDKSLKPRGYNLEKAKALLAQAGYDDRNGDGVIEDVHGKPFKFDLVYFQDSEDTQRIVLFLKDLYARAGILMIPKPTEWSVMIDLLQHKDFDAITLGWTSDVETDIFQIFHSSQTIPGGDNFINYRNPHLDTLIERARATVNEKARMQLWHKAERVLYEDQPYTFLMRVKSLIFIDDRMHNVQVTKLGLNKDNLPVEWFVPAGMQKYTN